MTPDIIAAFGAGVLRARELEARGVSRTQLSRWVATGELVRVARGLYALPEREVGEHEAIVHAAARVDGAGEIRIYHRIMLPLAMPGAVTLAIFTFIASWNNFFTPFILISSRDKYTLPMLVQTLQGDIYRTEYGAIYLGLAITVLPVIVIYLLLSKFIVSGIAMGSVKE